MTTWRNWAGNQRCEPSKLVRPRDEDELADRITAVHARRGRVRPVGTGHSFTPLATTDASLLDVSRLDGLLKLDLGMAAPAPRSSSSRPSRRETSSSDASVVASGVNGGRSRPAARVRDGRGRRAMRSAQLRPRPSGGDAARRVRSSQLPAQSRHVVTPPPRSGRFGRGPRSRATVGRATRGCARRRREPSVRSLRCVDHDRDLADLAARRGARETARAVNSTWPNTRRTELGESAWNRGSPAGVGRGERRAARPVCGGARLGAAVRAEVSRASRSVASRV